MAEGLANHVPASGAPKMPAFLAAAAPSIIGAIGGLFGGGAKRKAEARVRDEDRRRYNQDFNENRRQYDGNAAENRRQFDSRQGEDMRQFDSTRSFQDGQQAYTQRVGDRNYGAGQDNKARTIQDQAAMNPHRRDLIAMLMSRLGRGNAPGAIPLGGR